MARGGPTKRSIGLCETCGRRKRRRRKKKEEEEETAKERSQDLDGATAADDGYCFGRESVEEAVAAVGRGELVVVVDDMDRENEGDFIMAADLCTAEAMATIVRYSSGVVCVGMEGERMDSLGLPAMVASNEDPKGTAFSVTVDAAEGHGVTTGISAKDRSLTMRLLAAGGGGGEGRDGTGRLRPARPYLPPPGQGRGNDRARRPYRGRGRSVPAGGKGPSGGPLRDRERGGSQRHGPPSRAAQVQRGARVRAYQHRRHCAVQAGFRGGKVAG